MSGYSGRSRTNRRMRNNKGSFLLEALLSVVILSVSITMIIQSMTASFRAMVYSGQYTAALILLENKMSDVIRKGFISAGLDEEDDFPEPYQRYRYFLRTNPSDEDQKINEVSLAVEWAAGKRKNRVGLTTYLLNTPQ